MKKFDITKEFNFFKYFPLAERIGPVYSQFLLEKVSNRISGTIYNKVLIKLWNMRDNQQSVYKQLYFILFRKRI